MPNANYQFDFDSMRFDRVPRGIKSKLAMAFRLLLASFALAVISYIVYSFFFNTPRERQMAKENARMQEQLAELTSRYERVESVLKDIEKRDENIFRTIFESEPVRSDAQEAARAVGQLYEAVQAEGVESVVARTTGLLHGLGSATQEVSRAFDRLIALTQNDSIHLAAIPSIQPIGNEQLTRVAAPFGVRIHPFYKVLKMHTGIDFTAPIGTPVRATADGEVQQMVASKRGYGNTVIIKHGMGYSTLYAHLDQVMVRNGQKVTRGEVIGTVGNSGMSMAPHLHYEVQMNNQPIDPLNYFFMELDPARLARMALIASQTGQSLD